MKTTLRNRIADFCKAYDKLRWCFDHCNTNWTDKLLEQCKVEEKCHRGFGDDFHKYHPDACTVTEAAKLFAVKRIAEYLLGHKMPVGQDYLHTQTSCFIAAGMVDEFREDILKAWSDIVWQPLAELDYCDFVKTKAQAARDWPETQPA